MLLIRSTVLGTLHFTTRLVSRLLGVYIVLFFVATGLSLIDGAKATRAGATIIETERAIHAPAASFLKKRIATELDGTDLAPLIFATGMLLLFVGTIFYQDRLAYMSADVASDRKLRKLQREEKKKQKALNKQRKKDLLAAEKEARERQEKVAQYKAQLEAIEKAQAESAQKKRQEDLQALEAEQAAPTKQEAERLHAEREAAEKARMEAEALAHARESAPAGGKKSREELLEILALTKKSLDEQKQNLSFLAIDVVDSTGMKIGEEAAIAERDFRQYKKVVEKAIAANKGLKAAWTPDGVMICFKTVQGAVQAAQQVIKDLDHFNKHVKAIKRDFKVRCGINAGNVLFDDTVPMEEMSDRAIDIAGHMQKYAKADTIFIGKHAIEGIRMAGFKPASQQVDGCDVYEWTKNPDLKLN